MGYCYEVQLSVGGTVVKSWSVCGSYGCIDGDSHPFNVMQSLDYFADPRTQVERVLKRVREEQDSGRWEETEEILVDMLAHLDIHRYAKVNWIDADMVGL